MPNVADVAIQFAMAQVGKPYQWGATGPNSYDCSGLVYTAYRHAGVMGIPRTTPAQIYWCKVHPSRQALLPGDLVAPDPGHVQMYIGGGKVVEAPHTGANVRVINMWGFWRAGRVTAVPGTAVSSSWVTPVDSNSATGCAKVAGTGTVGGLLLASGMWEVFQHLHGMLF